MGRAWLPDQERRKIANCCFVEILGETDDEGQSTGKTKAVMTRYFRVFNSCQVEGDYARGVKQKFKSKLIEHDPIAQAEDFVTSYSKVERLPIRASDHAYYSGGIGEHICMPELGQFHSAEHYYSVFAHEITHSTGSASRLSRDMSGRFGGYSKCRRYLH